MLAMAVPSHSSAALSSNEDADLSAAFGLHFTALPKEILTNMVPAERTIMLCRVSKGARSVLAAARPAAVVKGRGGCTRIPGLGERLSGMMCLSLAHLNLCGILIMKEGARYGSLPT